MLCGYRPPAAILEKLRTLCPRELRVEIAAFAAHCNAAGLKALFGRLLSLEPRRRRNALAEARTLVLEPVMRLEVRAPEEFLGPVMKDLGARRAEIRESALVGGMAVVRGLVPLAEMFGYSTRCPYSDDVYRNF